MRLSFCVLATTALFSAQVYAAPASKVRIESFAAPADFSVNTHLVESNGEVLVVDAQMLLPHADLAIEAAKKLGKVTTIWLTHHHPDHFLALQKWKEAFPQARVLAHPKTVASIKEGGAKELEGFRKNIGDKVVASELVVPEGYSGKTLQVGGASLDILELSNAESSFSTMLFDRNGKNLLAGDALFYKVHLWLADLVPSAWLTSLDEGVKPLQGKVKTVYPGHGPVAEFETVLRWNVDYLSKFAKFSQKCTDQQTLEKEVLAAFPDIRGKNLLGNAVKSGLYCKK